MKSREEYQASIFAKRDALLRKRKRLITHAVSGTAAAVLLTASIIAVPKMTAKLPLDSEQTIPDITTTQYAYGEECITQQHSDYDNHTENEEATDTVSETASVTYAYYSTSDETTAAAASETKKSPETNEIAPESAEAEVTNENEEVAIMGELSEYSTAPESTSPADTGNDYAPETGSDNAAETVIDSVAPEAPDSFDGYTQEDIISAAITHLPDDAKELADPENAFVTVTKTSEGEKYYEVRFDINGTKHKVIIDSENLEMIAVESTNNSSSEQPQIQTSPPYNPNR